MDQDDKKFEFVEFNSLQVFNTAEVVLIECKLPSGAEKDFNHLNVLIGCINESLSLFNFTFELVTPDNGCRLVIFIIFWKRKFWLSHPQYPRHKCW